MRKYNAKPPVKPIGRILYSERYQRHWDPKMYDNGGYRFAGFQKVCECKGFSDDRPFAVYRYERELASNEKPPKKVDPKPFKVVFCWTNEHHKTVKVFQRQGEWRNETDYDTYAMMDIIEEHETKAAAQKAMRRFATEAFAKVNDAPKGEGSLCHNTYFDHKEEQEYPLNVGDLIVYTSCPGIVWRVEGERRANDSWFLKVNPVFSFMVSNGTEKRKELAARDVYNYVRHADLLDMGTAYMNLGNLLRDEAKRLAR